MHGTFSSNNIIGSERIVSVISYNYSGKYVIHHFFCTLAWSIGMAHINA